MESIKMLIAVVIHVPCILCCDQQMHNVPGQHDSMNNIQIALGDQKVSIHLMITVQKNTQKYFKQFQSLTTVM
jgi:hypothetical protein